MKKLQMMLILMMVLVSTQTFAQNRTWDPEQMAKRQTEQMSERLSLSEEQSAQVFEINKKISEKMQEARNNGELTADNRREFRQQQNEERNTELKKVLTEEQWTSWEALQKEQQNRSGRERRGSGRGRGNGNRL